MEGDIGERPIMIMMQGGTNWDKTQCLYKAELLDQVTCVIVAAKRCVGCKAR